MKKENFKIKKIDRSYVVSIYVFIVLLSAFTFTYFSYKDFLNNSRYFIELSNNDFVTNDIRALENKIRIFNAGQSIEVSFKKDEFGTKVRDEFSMTNFMGTFNRVKSLTSTYSIIFRKNLYLDYLVSLLVSILLILSIELFFQLEKNNFTIISSLNDSLKSKERSFQIAQKLAHDIRSPLSTLSLLSSKFTDPGDKELVTSILNQITGISQDLLNSSKRDLSKVSQPTANNVSIDNVPKQSFSKLLNQLNTEYGIKQPNIKSQIQFRIEKSVLNISDFAPIFLYSSINNLIQNSIEATEASTDPLITIDSNLNSDNKFELTIEDNGKGIPESVLAQLGKTPVSYGKAESTSGSGIGIYSLSKNLAEIGGHLSISSIPNEKTAFRVVFPVSTF